jgi:hypothetical protein
MSRGKKRKRAGWQERQRRSTSRDDDIFDEVAEDTAAVFTCSEKIVDDFSGQCARGLEELETDLQFAQIAHEIWQGRSGRAQELAEALAALHAEHERRREALTALHARFEALAADSSWHEHLDPVEQWRDFVRKRLFPVEPPT